MSEVIRGVVQSVDTKDVSGGRKAYNVVVGGQAYGAGLYAPKCKEGDYIQFDVDESRGYKNVARNSLKVSKNKPPAEAVQEAQTTAPKQNSAGGTVDSRQDIISRQAAANTAIAYLSVLSAADTLGFPASAAKGKKMETMDTLLQKYTEHFYESNTGIAFKNISPAKTEEDSTEEHPDNAEAEVADDDWT